MSVFVLILPNSVGIRGVIHRRVNSMPVGIDFDQSSFDSNETSPFIFIRKTP